MTDIQAAVAYIQAHTNHFQPATGIILGTGLGVLAKEVEVEHEISYADIPNFPVSTVESHAGRLLLGTLNGQKVAVLQGRFHYYEGYSMAQVVLPVRVLKLLGITQLFVSNAAGGLNPEFAISDLMLIDDHINLLPGNPLIGPNLDELGPRFPDMYAPYDAACWPVPARRPKRWGRAPPPGAAYTWPRPAPCSKRPPSTATCASSGPTRWA